MSGGVGAGSDRARFYYDDSTGEFGWQIKLTNNTGSNSVKGELVEADTTDDMSFKQSGADSLEVIGVVYEGGVADGSDAWIWTGQGTVCQVLLKDGTAATRGYWVSASDTAGRADATSASAPGAVLQHFYEIGHCLESAGSGTDVLARILFHTL
jgi:hypothetical protein